MNIYIRRGVESVGPLSDGSWQGAVSPYSGHYEDQDLHAVGDPRGVAEFMDVPLTHADLLRGRMGF